MKKILALLSILALGACSSLKGNWDFDPQVNFSNFKTYAWIVKKTDDSGYHLDGLMEQRVHDAVDAQLSAKGISKVDETSADILVNYLTKTDKKVDVDTFNSNFGYNPYYGRNWWWGGSTQTQTTVREYEINTLMVDVVDNKTKKLIWRGSIKDTLKKNKTPQQKTESINKAISQVMANFPPKPNEG
ncbi:DUF4136 domain-containing protein [Parashewanella spongiae]|uniref:DUF4136 domain-containing protein n=1 Tax=Parashewanella spongiae TaxID=342950 RepID=A0A3A6U8X1_9GAMM|nr:DUF4136 domain-containing protein [Parashewanella spongiae]MCL1078299.1 DUF4136 domain-containing protein [Parashewanella spongiae]RJY15023.1 DUF4136 domain-containing protein [Parashewanella spongiae]